MRKGIAELCVLATLSGGEAYGYEIMTKISKYPSLTLKESTLYLLLGRLAKEGFVSTRTAPSAKGPPRRYFRLTDKGTARLSDMRTFWSGFATDVGKVLEADNG